MTVAQSTTTVQFDAALRTAARKAVQAYPGEQARIDRGLVIALNGGVELLPNGVARVQSQSNSEIIYEVNGHCDCPDHERATEGRCKHRWAKSLHKWAVKVYAAQPVERYYATYYPPTGDGLQGIATWTERGWLFVADDGAEPLYAAIQALCLGGRCDLADSKKAEEQAAGGLAAIICGYGR